MKQFIKSKIRKYIPNSLLRLRNKFLFKQEYREWLASNGTWSPDLPAPHIVKQQTIAAYKDQHQCTTLVETGTYFGEMVEVQMKTFDNVISIELSPQLAREAQQRFRNNRNVEIVIGDSATSMPVVAQRLTGRTVFWLDGHYSDGVTAKGASDCPVYEELDAIFKYNTLRHVILIDDARYFTGRGDYPTIDELTSYIGSKDLTYNVTVKDDIIRCTPA
ncbi:MAG: hypothetical protein JNL32_07020 [Candidatus Kapabacteria bacterium]|nr:hypothetical protein [Candidatus Kapabacteria bacterium]